MLFGSQHSPECHTGFQKHEGEQIKVLQNFELESTREQKTLGEKSILPAL